jgi:hypothetical protein
MIRGSFVTPFRPRHYLYFGPDRIRNLCGMWSEWLVGRGAVKRRDDPCTHGTTVHLRYTSRVTGGDRDVGDGMG